ncbi:unnamed protein product [Paramecium pentaurelia]|uniref:Uncharacterized protein n=1 Tax=Paramecium pentaurelia TaxID=43138 RepID=A0A8S1UYY8_9CILI|nr:unnamed protein product [Paramecium pentaurelia]CAD8169935.1 unnamed protein product [Paramecium pentaurelia]
MFQSIRDSHESIQTQKPKAESIQWHLLSPEKFEWEREKKTSCSVLIKALDDWSDLCMAPSTQTNFENKLRLIKAIRQLYLKENYNMVVIEMRNSILDSKLYDLIAPTSLLTWSRFMQYQREENQHIYQTQFSNIQQSIY